KPDQWAAALAVGEQELRRALEHGFQAGELAETKASFRNSLEQAVRGAATRRSGNLAGEIAQSILDERVFSHPTANRDLYLPAIERITPADCLAALREAFSGNGRHLMVSGNTSIPGDAAAAILAAHTASAKVPVAAPAAEAEAKWAYTDFGPPGKVVKREQVADLDVTLVSFENGVRLNLKRTDFEAGLRVSARVGTGGLTEPADRRGLVMLANSSFTAGGLGRHSVDDLRRLLAGRNASIGFRIGSDALELGNAGSGRGGGPGGTTRADLLLTLQLLTAHLTDPGYRPEALRQVRTGMEQMYTGFEHTPNGPLSTEVARLIAGGDHRFGVPPRDVLMARNLDEVRDWLSPQLKRGAIEVAVVGDLDVEETINAVARTLGALPPRDPRPDLADLRRVSFPKEPFTREYTISSEIPKGVVSLYWPTADASDIRRTRRLTMLASVFSDRLRVKIREEMGGTYSPRAGSSTSDTFAGYGYITSSIDVDPATAAKVREAVVALADDLARNGVTA
ncbi:MAG: insulinase family protein, partial [Opitutaceae bacterium]